MALDQTTTEKFINALNAYPAKTVTRPEITEIAAKEGLPFPRWYCNIQDFRETWGSYRKATLEECLKLGVGYAVPGTRIRNSGSDITPTSISTEPIVVDASESTKQVLEIPRLSEDDYKKLIIGAIGNSNLLMHPEFMPNIPARFGGYVKWGHFDTVSQILSSKHFLPIMITGPSGNGKTEMVEQVCADGDREFVRVNITNQTDSDDLCGSWALVNGDTKFRLGPVPMAMITGAVLLLDEIDLGQAGLMCLQPVLEGKPLFLNKIGKHIYPKAGFTVVATANTKGRGDDGKYAHTNIMNEAMLERFALMFEQGWPNPTTEKKIIGYVMKQEGRYNSDLVNNLVNFADSTRKTFANQTCNDQIATRRLIHIVRSYCTFGDINKVMELSLARFEPDTAKSMMEAWRAINDKASKSSSGSPIPTF